MDGNPVDGLDGSSTQCQRCIDAETEKLDIATKLKRHNQTITSLIAVKKNLTESLMSLETGKLEIAFTKLKLQNQTQTIQNLMAVNKNLTESVVSLQSQLYDALGTMRLIFDSHHAFVTEMLIMLTKTLGVI